MNLRQRPGLVLGELDEICIDATNFNDGNLYKIRSKRIEEENKNSTGILYTLLV